MIVIALVALAAIGTLAALLLRKEHQQEVLVSAWLGERAQWAKERQLLLNRIQSPETAVAQAVAGDLDDLPKSIPYDNDEAFFEATGRS